MIDVNVLNSTDWVFLSEGIESHSSDSYLTYFVPYPQCPIIFLVISESFIVKNITITCRQKTQQKQIPYERNRRKHAKQRTFK